MERLPPELVMYMFEWLPVHAIHTCSMVSHGIRTAALNEHMWLTRVWRDFGADDTGGITGVRGYVYAARLCASGNAAFSRAVALTFDCGDVCATVHASHHNVLRDIVHAMLMRGCARAVVALFHALSPHGDAYAVEHEQLCMLFTTQMCRDTMLSLPRDQYAHVVAQYRQYCTHSHMEDFMTISRALQRRGVNGAAMAAAIDDVTSRARAQEALHWRSM